jgi:AcrR family transcriptional regulator
MGNAMVRPNLLQEGRVAVPRTPANGRPGDRGHGRTTTPTRRPTPPVVARKGKPGRPKNGNSEETRLRILDVAVDAFAQGGFHGMATRTIAERAGVSPSTVYHHFSTKQGLYVQSYRHAIDLAYEEYAIAVSSHESLIDELHAMLQCSLKLMRARPAISALAVRARIDLTDPGLRPLAGTRVARTFIDGMIERAVDRGELDPADSLSLERITEVFMWGLSVLAAEDDRIRRECVNALDRLLGGMLIPPKQSAARAPRQRHQLTRD